jgi:hypothetical protein
MKTKFNFRIILLAALATGTIVLLFFSQGLKAQKNEKGQKPNVKISVNKKTDQNGNVVQYDSTYSYSWSGNTSSPENSDSVFQSIDKQFGNNSFFGKQHFGIFNDSDFFSVNDSSFFGNTSKFFGSNSDINKEMERMMQQQEAMMEHFFGKNSFNFRSNPFFNEPLLKVPDGVKPKDEVTPKKESYKSGIEL